MATRVAATQVFDEFVETADPRLRRALVAAYGTSVGREAALDALSWAWEHWDRLPVDVTPELLPALARLSEQQRTVVVLIHGFAYTQREVAELLEIAVSTTREHLARGMAALRAHLEVPQ
jgi:DNA-directed RNA polymerase specialized sigma24 family protein